MSTHHRPRSTHGAPPPHLYKLRQLWSRVSGPKPGQHLLAATSTKHRNPHSQTPSSTSFPTIPWHLSSSTKLASCLSLPCLFHVPSANKIVCQKTGAPAIVV
ncbi:hypothetical protein M758_6G081400 [Ceratodon purpureus]|nr:hypothetical protein M758_6G081400 [Ceratodon purpureus]